MVHLIMMSVLSHRQNCTCASVTANRTQLSTNRNNYNSRHLKALTCAHSCIQQTSKDRYKNKSQKGIDTKGVERDTTTRKTTLPPSANGIVTVIVDPHTIVFTSNLDAMPDAISHSLRCILSLTAGQLAKA